MGIRSVLKKITIEKRDIRVLVEHSVGIHSEDKKQFIEIPNCESSK